MIFHASNKVEAYQDHCTQFYWQIPPGVDFTVSRCGDGFTLRACGYGCLQGHDEGLRLGHTNKCYGNGALYVSGANLTKKWRERFEEEIYVREKEAQKTSTGVN